MKRVIKELNIVSILIRVSGMSGKFLMVLAMASKLSLASVGLWGLLSGFVLLATFVLGLEAHTYYTPKISAQIENHRHLVQNIKGLVLIRILIFVIIYIGAYSILKNYITTYGLEILIIIVLDSTSQEINRFLVAKGKIVQSNIVIAIRSGLWCFIVLAFWYLFESNENLDIIVQLWIIFSLISILIGLTFDEDVRKIESPMFDELSKIISYSKFYIASSISMRSAFFIDKVIISYFMGKEILGIYTMFQTVFNSTLSFMEAGVLAKYFIVASKNYHKDGLVSLKGKSSYYKKIIVKSSFLLITLLLVGLLVYFNIVNNEDYSANWFGLLIIMIATIPFLVGQMFQINLNILDAGFENMKSRFYSAFAYLAFLLVVPTQLISFSILASGMMIFSVVSWITSWYFLRHLWND